MNYITLKECLKSINSKNIIPNVLLSLLAFKKFKCVTEIIKHKQRRTGMVILVNINLIRFCFKAVYELLIFKIVKF